MNPEDIFLPLCLTAGPLLGKQLGFLHYGRPTRAVRWGGRNRGLTTTIFTGGGGGSGSGAGNGGYGDPVLIEGPGPMYGTDDHSSKDSMNGGGGGLGEPLEV